MTSNMGPGQDTDTEIQTLKDAIDDVVDIYASLGKTQERIVTSIMKKPRTTDMFVAFMSILSEKLNGFTLLELKVKKLEESLKEALCTKKDMLKKQTHLEDQILDILACSTLRDMKTMLKKMVKDREIPTIARTKAAKKSTDQVQRDESILSTNVNDRTIKDRQLLEKADNITDLDITQPCDTVDNIKIEMNTEYDDEMNVSLEHDIEPTLDGITATVSKFKDDTDSDDTEDYDDPGADDPTADEDGADDGEFSLTNVKVEDEGEDVNMADQSDTTPADPSEAAPTEHKITSTKLDNLGLRLNSDSVDNLNTDASHNALGTSSSATSQENDLLKTDILAAVGNAVCTICNKSFSLKGNLKRHMIQKHGQMSDIQCIACGKAFASNSELREHLVVHSNITFNCSFCEKVFKSRTGLKYHRKQHDNVYKFICQICKKGYNIKTVFEGHLSKHNDQKLHKCDKCSKTFRYFRNMRTHYKVCGETINKYTCEICGGSFKQNAYLKEHLKIHDNSEPFQCSQCGNTYKFRASLYRHIKLAGHK